MKNIIDSARTTYQNRKVRKLERRSENFVVVPTANLEASELITGMLIESLCFRDEAIERLMEMLEAGEPTDRCRKELEDSIRRINEFEVKSRSDF